MVPLSLLALASGVWIAFELFAFNYLITISRRQLGIVKYLMKKRIQCVKV